MTQEYIITEHELAEWEAGGMCWSEEKDLQRGIRSRPYNPTENCLPYPDCNNCQCRTPICEDTCPCSKISRGERERVLDGRKLYRCKSDTCEDSGGVCILCIPDMDFEPPISCVLGLMDPDCFTDNRDEPDCEWEELRREELWREGKADKKDISRIAFIQGVNREGKDGD